MNRFYQRVFWEKIDNLLQGQYSLPDEIAVALQISKDAAYRRLRGETTLSFDETVLLARHFNISLNDITGISEKSVIFNHGDFIDTIDDYRTYMKGSLEMLQSIVQQKDHMMYYSAKDVPVFYQFAFPELAAFKIYVWLKSVYGISKINDQNYNVSMIPEDLLELASAQWEAFSRINSIEIWNDTTVMSFIKQIDYYYEAGLFSNREEALVICDRFHEMMKLIYKQALNGNKVHATKSEVYTSASYKMYYHEILIMDNHIVAEFNENRLFYFVPYAGVNYLSTSDITMGKKMKDYFLNQCKQSSLISDLSDKDRNKFFIRIKNRIDQVREKIATTDPFM